MIRVFKFGGASVKDAASVRNVAHIIQNHHQEGGLLVVVSAMGKTTNALEALWQAARQAAPQYAAPLAALRQMHQEIAEALLPTTHRLHAYLESSFAELEAQLQAAQSLPEDQSYDQIIAFGELLSSLIVSAYLAEVGLPIHYIDARKYIQTDRQWREARVDFPWTEQLIKQELPELLQSHILLTQGFIGSTLGGQSTTLGREGSDYSAAIFAHCLEAESLTIWKDVPGILNADPKKVAQTQLFERLSYREAAEMTFYGATVIHPKTIKPLANKGIPLYVKSFIEPQKSGTCISDTTPQATLPSIILKEGQSLLTFVVKDLAFITEENLRKILHEFTRLNIKINLMQSSAVSFLVCTEASAQQVEALQESLQQDFDIQQQQGLVLLTIMYYQGTSLPQALAGKSVVLEQKTTQHYRAVVRH
jgi:aspartate kinase